jgi:glutamine amidotransferase
MGGLAALPGMLEALDGAVIRGGKPFLGICVGMELMAEVGREHGDHAGLGWIPGEVAALAPADAALKIPHMGWNELAMAAPGHPVLAGISPGAHAYFVHSYAFVCADPAHVLATVEYGGPVTAAVGRDNMIGTQFHPEKSQATGLRLITNFLGWRP